MLMRQLCLFGARGGESLSFQPLERQQASIRTSIKCQALTASPGANSVWGRTFREHYEMFFLCSACVLPSYFKYSLIILKILLIAVAVSGSWLVSQWQNYIKWHFMTTLLSLLRALNITKCYVLVPTKTLFEFCKSVAWPDASSHISLSPSWLSSTALE